MLHHNNIGVNHMTNGQFKPESFDVVLHVYNHMHVLQFLFKNIHLFEHAYHNGHEIAQLSKYLNEIDAVSSNIKNVLELNSHINYIKEVLPTFKSFNNQLTSLNQKLATIDKSQEDFSVSVHENIKQLQDMYTKYEKNLERSLASYNEKLYEEYTVYKKDLTELFNKMLSMHSYVAEAYPEVKEAISLYRSQQKVIAHLQASNDVLLALYTKQEADFQKAYKAIKTSEALHNNEDINRKRLNYKLKEHNVLNVLKSNDHEYLTKQEGVQCECE